MDDADAAARVWHGVSPEMRTDDVPASMNEITRDIIACAIDVHRALGPGLLETVYETCLAHELRKRGRIVATQVPMRLAYDGLDFDLAFRLDMLVDGEVIVEIKAVESLSRIHAAQLLTYLKLTRRRVGLLLNFDEPLLKEGIRRLVVPAVADAQKDMVRTSAPHVD